MGEIELVGIENRIAQYPPQARHDVTALLREVRRLHGEASRKQAAPAGSPLYDELTGLLNGGAYGVRFAMARARATRFRKIFAVMSVDVSVSAGAAPGGENEPIDPESAVKAVAQRLESCVRATDTLARIGQQNFAIILEDLTQPGHAERVKQTVEDALAEPMRVGGLDLVPLTTVELQFYPAPGATGQIH